jgi:YtkA-like protein
MTRREGPSAWRFVPVLVALQLGCGSGPSARMTELQRIRSGGLDLVLLAHHDALQHGKDTFIIEFRSNGSLVDVGDVRATASMPMPGMPMFGSVDVQRTDVGGRYAANSQFQMAGTWRMTLDWDGAAGKGSVAFSGTVQ